MISGGGGHDVLSGGAGNDVIIGGADYDVMSGGTGADTFTYFLAADSLAGTATRDIILDFTHAVDKIDLNQLHLTAADIDLSHNYAGTYAQLVRISSQHNGIFDMEIQLNHTGGIVTLADLIF